jgi:hypothetical protein
MHLVAGLAGDTNEGNKHMTTATNTANINPMSALIAGAMRDEKTALNRSASLIALMFGNEVTYNKAALTNILRKEKSDKTDHIDDLLCSISTDFDAIKQAEFALTEKRKADKASFTDRDAENKVLYNKQMRAARIMFERALIATYGLRSYEFEVIEVSASTKRTGMLNVEFVKSRDGDKVRVGDKDYSCNELISAGNKALQEAAIRKARTSATSAKNPVANMADAAKALAATFNAVPVTTAYEDAFEGELASNLDSVFARMFRMRFFDGQTLDIDAVKDFAKEITAKPAAAPAAKHETKAA